MAFLLAAVHSCPSYRHLGGAAAEVPAAVVGHMNAVVRSAYAVAGESGKGVFPLHKWETFFLDFLFRKRGIVCAFDDSIIHELAVYINHHHTRIFVYILFSFCVFYTLDYRVYHAIYLQQRPSLGRSPLYADML